MATNPANPHKYWVFRWPLSDTKVGKVGKKWPFLQNFHQKLADTQDDFPKFFSKVGKISCTPFVRKHLLLASIIINRLRSVPDIHSVKIVQHVINIRNVWHR